MVTIISCTLIILFSRLFMSQVDCSWAPFDGDNYQLYLGGLDYAFLFAYAIGLFLSGHVAERLNLRYYLGKYDKNKVISH